MNCDRCNSPVPEGANYCPHCGKRMGDRATFTEEFKVTSEELVSKVKRLIEEGNVRRIKVKQDEKVVLDIPLTVGVVGTLLAPTLAAVGALAALLTEMMIEVERVA